MSENIDYDELDKAVRAASKTKTTRRVATAPKAATTPVQTAPAKRGQYIDFVRRPVSAATSSHAHKVTPPAPQPVAATPKRVAKLPTVSSSMPQYQPRNRGISTTNLHNSDILKKTAIRKPIAKTEIKPAAKIAQKPSTIAAAAKVAAKAAPQPVAEKTTTKRKAVPAGPLIKPEQMAKRSSSAAENYSIGGKSPFTSEKTKKHPLGEVSANELKSTKNTYSQRSPQKIEKVKKHIVTESPKKKSGWLWTAIVLLILITGAGLGYLAYLIIFAN